MGKNPEAKWNRQATQRLLKTGSYYLGLEGQQGEMELSEVRSQAHMEGARMLRLQEPLELLEPNEMWRYGGYTASARYST